MIVSRPTLIIATTNRGKLREFEALLSDLPVALQSLIDRPGVPLVEETGATYLENAALKALAIARWSGVAALADDSGLEVDYLGGGPGVRSACFAGPAQESEANVGKLLRELEGIPLEQRTARFRCVLVVAQPSGETLTVEGVCDGRIIDVRCGSGGFGYDPVFFYPPAARTFAQLTATVKNQVSHRARACARLRPALMPFMSAHGSANVAR